MAHCYTKHVECPDIGCSECNIKVRKEIIDMDTNMDTESIERFEQWLSESKQMINGTIKDGGDKEYISMLKDRLYTFNMISQRFNECKTHQPFGI